MQILETKFLQNPVHSLQFFQTLDQGCLIGLQLYHVVNGDIQEFIDELQLAENAEKLKEGTQNE